MRIRGLTLLEVVIALLLFAMVSVMLLSGHARASDAVLRATIDREIAELLAFRLSIIALQPEEYEDGDMGDFPSSGASTRLVDEDKLFEDRYPGYRWRVEMMPTIGAGASGTVSVAGGEPRNLLFEEESTTATDENDETEVESGQVDEMLFIRVTVYPPGYDEYASEDEQDLALRARSAWTAVPLPEEESEQR